MRRLSTVTVLVVAGIFLPATLANATTTSSPPSSTIKGASAAAAHFSPATLTGKVVEACSTTDYSFAVKNATKVDEQLTYSDADFGSPIAPGAALDVCFTKRTTAVFGLAGNTSASLTVTIK
jgi:hypothetical protein